MAFNKRKFLTRVLYAALLLLTISWLLLTTIDTTPYKQTTFYKSTMDRVDSLVGILDIQTPSSTLEAGWGVVNITPQSPVRLTGKNFSPYQQVFDSVYVRTLLFDNGQQKVAILSYDLWIIHPTLANAIRALVRIHFPDINGIFFTANHSHTSIGGWASGLIGTLVVGGNHPEMIEFLGEQTITALRKAEHQLRPVTIGSGEIETKKLVMNRLDAKGKLDEKLRVLKLVNDKEEVAVFSTFSAHSVYMNKDINTLSADYPGYYLKFLTEIDEINFASFSPGATGSHTPIGRTPFERSKMTKYAQELAKYFRDLQGNIKTDSTDILKYMEWPVDLRSPHFRVSNQIRFRPWVFNALMDVDKANITVLRVGNVVMVGLPVELSGEFYHQFDAMCKQRGLSLMITSFNGWYLGYAPPQHYYFSLNRSETRDMNWFGPQNGEYFVELITKLLTII